MDKEQFLVDECRKINLELTSIQIEQFMKFYELLIEWNSFMNLTGITEYKEVVVKHFIDSLSINSIIDLSEKKYKVIDLGTGAGFPGIPLKIAYPNIEIILVDSLNKRIKFLDEVIHQLNLEGVTTIHSRAESLGVNTEYREKFDYCVSRAVANMSVLAEYCMPFVKVGGSFLPYKSGTIEEELKQANNAITLLGGKNSGSKYFELPDTDIHRAIVKIDKIKKTPKQFPRSEGKPTKEPLL